MENPTESVCRWTFGDIAITQIVELGPMVIPPFAMLSGQTDADLGHDWLRPDFVTDDGFLRVNVQCFVIETAGRRILVDTGVGNDKQRQMVPHFNMLQTAFLDRLAKAGFPPDTIDTVLCTHLHQDHVGWNTRLAEGHWIPTFPQARYLFGRQELEAACQAKEEAGRVLADSIQPILDAGLVDLIEFDADIAPGISLDAAPGHSGGQFAVWLTSQGATAVLAGDVLQHPVQAVAPDVCSTYCADKEKARASRRRFLTKVSKTGATMFASHFTRPVSVSTLEHGTSWRVDPVA